MSNIGANVARIHERVARAAERSGRPADCVRIIAAAKTQPPARIVEALRAGIRDIGENYVQEAAAKIDAVGLPARWHLIGHLQRNKVGRAVQLFDVIETVDNVALGAALARRGAQLGRSVAVLIEVNVGGEANKSGVAPERVADLVAALSAQQHLNLQGLMAIPPPVATADAARPYFIALRRLHERLARAAPTLVELSMGMTDDFEVAIEEGATMVRIGRAIFGPRD